MKIKYTIEDREQSFPESQRLISREETHKYSCDAIKFSIVSRDAMGCCHHGKFLCYLQNLKTDSSTQVFFPKLLKRIRNYQLSKITTKNLKQNISNF